MIFDLAVAQGGNVEGSKPDEVVVKHGVKIIGYSNIAGAPGRPMPRRCFRATSTTSSAPSGTRSGQDRRAAADDEIGKLAIRLTAGRQGRATSGCMAA